MATVIVAAGCHDHLYDFGVSVVPGDGSVPDAQPRDGGQTGGRTGAGGTPRDGGAGGTAGTVGTGGVGGHAGTGGSPPAPAFRRATRTRPRCRPTSRTAACASTSASFRTRCPSCVAGKCQFTCQTGFFDADNDPSNGCECSKTNGGIEICDGIDNDCNGTVDDGFDLMSDVNNCGALQSPVRVPVRDGQLRERRVPAGAPACRTSTTATRTCPAARPQCIKTNGGVEICDGLDNDCDGVVDDNLRRGHHHLPARRASALASQPACSGSTGWVCNYPVDLRAASRTRKFGCDGLDNDCNGQTTSRSRSARPASSAAAPAPGPEAGSATTRWPATTAAWAR